MVGRATLLLIACTATAMNAQTVKLKRGMVITTSVRITKSTYHLPAPASLDSSAIIIRGSNITVDFNGATLIGNEGDPDQFGGVAIKIDGGENVVVKNARVGGYKIGLLARGTRELSLLDNDFSDNWKPRLFSLIEHESLVDWLSHHHNEKDEWLRFGAGVYLSDVKGGVIRGNRIERGMEGLMLVRCNGLRILSNYIQFNSGVGIGLYRSSDNLIAQNYASFNVRGYSHGFYRRGQDSADLLMYEQSSRNIVKFNSMTHGGDGLFLWAGQSTMDTGEGGSNDNHFIANDFSYAPTNAMEATFSRNTFIANRAHGSEYGLWGGYSFESMIISNDFAGNRTGIAIEHGQKNLIEDNSFTGDSTAINLWAIPEQPSDWGYPKHRDTRSRDYQINDNRFTSNRVALRIANTTNARFFDNIVRNVDSVLVVRDTFTHVSQVRDTASWMGYANDTIPGALDPTGDPLAMMPRSAIIVDEWGPYDWRSPKLWPVDSTYGTPMKLRVLGREGAWRVSDQFAVSSVKTHSGMIGDTIVVTPLPGHENNWSITLSSNGKRFSFERFQPIAPWQLKVYEGKDSTRGKLLFERETARLDYMWYRPLYGFPQDNYTIDATSTVDLARGSYTLRTISDDAIRVWVDDKLVIDHWTPHESLVDNAPIAAGKHRLRAEYYQKDGWMELRVEIVKGAQRSEGSPGPH